MSGSNSVSCWLSWADASCTKNPAEGRYVCKYAYPAGELTIWEASAEELLLVWVGGVPGRGAICSVVGCQHRSGRGAPIPLHLQHVCGFIAVPFCQRRHLAVWYWRNIAGCLSIAAFTSLCPGNSTPRLFSSRTSAQGVLIRYCISSIAAHKNPSLAILAIFKARRISDCSSCTRPPCYAIVADMLKTYKKLVATSNNEIRLLPVPYTFP